MTQQSFGWIKRVCLGAAFTTMIGTAMMFGGGQVSYADPTPTDQMLTISVTYTAPDDLEAGTTILFSIVVGVYKGGNAGVPHVLIQSGGTNLVPDPGIQCAGGTPGEDGSNNTLGSGGKLSTGDFAYCTYAYQLTQDDIDNGSLGLSFTAVGIHPNNNTRTGSGSATFKVVIPLKPLELTKTVDPQIVTGAGQQVTYTYTVTNKNHDPMDHLDIIDPQLNGAPVHCDSDVLAASSSAPNNSTKCTATYTLTEDDLAAKSYTNTATAEATMVSGEHVGEVETSNSDSATVYLAQLTFDKKADPLSVSNVGDEVTYTFEATNTGSTYFDNVSFKELSMQAGGRSVSHPITQVTCKVDVTDDEGVTTPTDMTVQLDPPIDSGIAMAPRDTLDCVASYKVTEADILAGSVVNKAVATGDAYLSIPSDPPLVVQSSEAGATVTTGVDAKLHLAKTGAVDTSTLPSGLAVAGTTKVDYTFTVTNNGNVTLRHIRVVDGTDFTGTNPFPAVSCDATTLSPGAGTTCTATYTLTQEDIDAGFLDNSATVTGRDGKGDLVTSDPDTANVDLSSYGHSALDLVKTATLSVTGNHPVVAGGTHPTTVAYEFAVKNTGNLTVDSLRIRDFAFTGDVLGAITCGAKTLAPGDSTTCTATYALEQTDIDRGSVDNKATAIGWTIAHHRVISNVGSANVDLKSHWAPGLSLRKSIKTSAAAPTPKNAGDSFTYQFLVRNTGNVTLSPISIDETNFTGSGSLGAVDCPKTSLAPGEFTICTADYALTQADVDKGSVSNTAQASGTDPGGNLWTSHTSRARINIPDDSAMTLTKSGVLDSAHALPVVGDKIKYTFEVTNTGNQTLTNVSVEDLMISATDISCASTIAPGATESCTALYTLTQDDIDKGYVDNAATAHDGTNAVTDTAEEHVVIPQAAGMTLTKTADKTQLVLGETVTYTIQITRTGNVTIRDLQVMDPLIDSTNPVYAKAAWNPHQHVVNFTVTHVVDQADIDAGTLVNTATATAKNVDESDGTAMVYLSELTLSKTVDPESTSGGEVKFNFDVKNTGATPVEDVNFDEVSMLSGSDPVSAPITAVTCLVPDPHDSAAPKIEKTVQLGHDSGITLAAKETLHCYAPYTVTDADILAGSVTNTAAATGSAIIPDVANPADVTSESSTAILDTTENASLSLTKTGAVVASTLDSNGLAVADSTQVTYTFTVTNTGNVAVHDIKVEDGSPAFTGTNGFPTVSCDATTLQPGDETTCAATYTLSQADINAGILKNKAKVTGLDGLGKDVTPGEASTDVKLFSFGQASLHLDKTVTLSVGADDPVDTSTTVNYKFVVKNTGNLTIDSLAIRDYAFTGTGVMGAITCGATTLAPGATTTCTAAVYPLSQGDINQGSLDNKATAYGHNPAGRRIVSNESTAHVDLKWAPGLSLKKSIETSAAVPTPTNAGDAFTYQFLVTNTGNVTMDSIGITETSFTGSGSLGAVDCPKTSLAPGEFTICTADYTLNQADVDRGSVRNAAVATGKDPDSQNWTSHTSRARILIPDDSAMTLTKDGKLDSAAHEFPMAGDKVDYTFEVTNTGNKTLAGITIDDALVPDSSLSCDTRTIAPSETMICTGSYALTQPDIDAGHVDNAAYAQNGNDSVESKIATASVTIPQAADIKLTKTADKSELVLDDTITYTIQITRTGNVTIHDFQVMDLLIDPDNPITDCTKTAWNPHQHVVSCTVTHVVDQADIDAGTLTNTATATAQYESYADGPTEITLDSSDDVSLDAVQSYGLDLTETVDKLTAYTGDTLLYTYVVTNTGNVDLTNVTVDELEFTGRGVMSAAPALVQSLSNNGESGIILAPGESLTFQLPLYTTVHKDAVQGSVVSTGVASADPVATSQRTDPIVSNQMSVTTKVTELAKTIAQTGGTLAPSPWLVGSLAVLMLLVGAALMSIRRRLA